MANTAEETKTITVDHSPAACDGGGGPLGHPRVYLTLEKGGEKDCPYCGLRFVLADGASASH